MTDLRPDPISRLMLMLSLLLAAPAQAQQEDARPVQAQPRAEASSPAQDQYTENFGSWALVCSKKSDEAQQAQRNSGNCALFQALADQVSKKRIFGQTVSYGPRGNLVLVVRTPEGVALQQGLVIAIEGGKTYRAAFQTCRQGICEVLLPLSEEMQQELRNAKHVTLKVHALNGKPFEAAAPYNGFADGLDALAKRRAAVSSSPK